MPSSDIIAKLKKAKLLGRSGSGFQTWLKWEMVKKAKAKKKYIICNGAAGEPSVFKDGYILQKYPEEVVEGIKIALKTIDNSSGYIYLRKEFYQKYKKPLSKLVKGLPITFFKKKGGYLAGEETTVCEVIEGQKSEPRIKPPFPVEAGLWGCPTLINNVETFYYISKIAKNQYKNTRFYSISGDVPKRGVFELPENWSVEKILKETGNSPKFDFFLQAGGGACGEILLPKELKRPVGGPGGIIVYNRKKTQPFTLLKKWADFFLEQNCDKCTPCREGIYRLSEMINQKKVDKETLEDILFVLKETSFCGLGRVAPNAFNSLINKLCKSLLTEKK